MENKDLWGDLLNSDINSTDGVKPFIRLQAKLLKEKTNNKVFCKFAPLKRVGAFATTESISKMFAKRGLTAVSYEFDDGIDEGEIKDANALYKEELYGFEIRNNNFKFRLFEISIPPVYPIQITIDDWIDNETFTRLSPYLKNNLQNSYIESQADLENILSLMFASRKLIFIIKKMMESA